MRASIRHGRLAVVAGILGIGLLVPTPAAQAESPTLFGWWTSANVSGVPATEATDVPPGGFEVTAASSVEAFAAIGHITDGAEVSAIVLDLAANTASVPGTVLMACPLVNQSPFSPAQGGPLSDGPAYNCTAKSIPGVISADGTRIRFAVSGMTRDNYLGVAVVVSGSGRQVFTRPSDDTVQLTDDSGPEPSFDDPTTPGTPQDPVSGSELPELGAVEGPALGPPSTLQPDPDSSAPHVAPSASAGPGAPRTDLVAVTAPTPTIGTGKTVIGAGIVLLLALGTWSKNRQLAADTAASADDDPKDRSPIDSEST